MDNKYIYLTLATTILIAGFFGYRYYSEKKAAREDIVDTFEEKIPSQCENGVWTEFPEIENPGQYKKFSGNAKLRYDDENDIFSDEKGSGTFSTDKNYSLSFFMDRDVRIEGYEIETGGIYVKRIKCVGAEANKETVQSRRKLMNYIKNNINVLALEKAPKNDWQVETFYFASDTDVYVQYESEGSFIEEAPYDSRLWLIRVSKMEREVPVIETLAYIQEDEEDPEKNVLKQGKDIYKDAKNLTVYEFDEEAKQWVLQ